MARKLTTAEMISGGQRFFRYLLCGGLLNVNLEVTKRCNARCDFCDYWKIEAPEELTDYVPVVNKLKPLSVGLTGGEPLLREDLANVIADLRQNVAFLHIGLMTNGALLTYARGLELWHAGLDRLSISLDYLDQRHDRERGIPGLYQHIVTVAEELSAAGVGVCFNVVMKRENYREVPQIVRTASTIGVKVSLSTYNCWRINNEAHMIDPNESAQLKAVLEELKRLKKSMGNLTTSHYYLDLIPRFVATRSVAGCTAGLNWLQVTPDGMLKRCSDHPVRCHYSEWHERLFAPSSCGNCWYSCRGAAQEPWTMERFLAEAKEVL